MSLDDRQSRAPEYPNAAATDGTDDIAAMDIAREIAKNRASNHIR
jgi:hypothetical protein